MPHWVDVACISDCPPGTALEVVAENRVIALFNVGGTLHALDGVCPHQGGPLAQGQIEGPIVTCPWHGWQFNLCTGIHQLNPRIVQGRFDVRVDGERILVDLG